MSAAAAWPTPDHQLRRRARCARPWRHGLVHLPSCDGLEVLFHLLDGGDGHFRAAEGSSRSRPCAAGAAWRRTAARTGGRTPAPVADGAPKSVGTRIFVRAIMLRSLCSTAASGDLRRSSRERSVLDERPGNHLACVTQGGLRLAGNPAALAPAPAGFRGSGGHLPRRSAAALAEVADLPLLDVPVVLGQRVGEDMGAVVPADEVQVRRWPADRGLERAQAGVCDGPGREAGIAISVARRIGLAGPVAREVAIVAARLAAARKSRWGSALHPHPRLQAVPVDRAHPAAFLGCAVSLSTSDASVTTWRSGESR